MTDQRREERIYSTRSAYMHYIHTTDMARRHERQRQLAQLDEEIRRNEAMMLKRQRDSRMHTEQAIRELRLEQERRRIKEEQRRQEHEERRRLRNQNREELKRELERIKNELRAELAKEDIKCQKAEEDDREQHEEESEQHEEEESEQHDEERKMLTFIQQKEMSLKHTEGRQPIAELKTKEHKQRHKEMQSATACQENEIMQDETEEEQRNVDERENEHKTCMEQNEASSEELRGMEVQSNYSENCDDISNTASTSSDDTPQENCTCSSIPDDQLNITCAKIATLEKLQNIDRQKKSGDQALEHCIAQECVSDDIVQCDCAHASPSDEPLQVFETKNINLKVHHSTDLQEKVMQRSLQKYIAQECASEVPQSMTQLGILNVDSEVREILYAESRDIVLTFKNNCLCFKFLWWQEGTLSS